MPNQRHFSPARFLKICFEVPIGTDSSTAVGDDDITLGNENNLRSKAGSHVGSHFGDGQNQENPEKLTVSKSPLKRESSGEICRRSAVLEEGKY